MDNRHIVMFIHFLAKQNLIQHKINFKQIDRCDDLVEKFGAVLKSQKINEWRLIQAYQAWFVEDTAQEIFNDQEKFKEVMCLYTQ